MIINQNISDDDMNKQITGFDFLQYPLSYQDIVNELQPKEFLEIINNSKV